MNFKISLNKGTPTHYFVIIICLAIYVPGIVHASFYQNCQAVLLAVVKPITRQHINLSPNAIYELKSAQKIILERKQSKKITESGVPIPKQIMFKGETYNVITYLGCGGEGEVFLVEKNYKKFTLKKFYNLKNMQANVDLTTVLQLRGFDVVMPLDMSLENNLVLYPYLDAVNVGEIIRPNIYEAPLVSKETREQIEVAFDAYKHNSAPFKRFHPSGIDIIHWNVMLSFEPLQFIIYDPK